MWQTVVRASVVGIGLGLSGAAFAQDNDGDGFTPAQGDCDDNDAAINPRAPEVCDGLDNDCNGSVDDNCGSTTWTTGTSTWTTGTWTTSTGTWTTTSSGRDWDGDGYGDLNDCDDRDPNVNPGASEVCDGVDNDCDGSVDEDCTTTTGPAPVDADGDGFDEEADCDDQDATTYPGADELCDGIDNSCDGEVDEDCTETDPTDPTDPTDRTSTGTDEEAVDTGAEDDKTGCDVGGTGGSGLAGLGALALLLRRRKER